LHGCFEIFFGSGCHYVSYETDQLWRDSFYNAFYLPNSYSKGQIITPVCVC